MAHNYVFTSCQCSILHFMGESHKTCHIPRLLKFANKAKTYHTIMDCNACNRLINYIYTLIKIYEKCAVFNIYIYIFYLTVWYLKKYK